MTNDPYDYAIKNNLVKADKDGTIYKRYSDGKMRKAEQSTVSSGYKVVNVVVGNKRRNLVTHRIVAKTYIPNPENKPQVNHIDGDKQNNHVNNLEWCTAKENAHHAIYELAPKCPDCGKSTRTSDGICPMCRLERYRRQKGRKVENFNKEIKRINTKDISINERNEIITYLVEKGHSQQMIGKEFGISRQRIYQIIKNKTKEVAK